MTPRRQPFSTPLPSRGTPDTRPEINCDNFFDCKLAQIDLFKLKAKAELNKMYKIKSKMKWKMKLKLKME